MIERHRPESAAEIVGDRLHQMAIAKGMAPLYNETSTCFSIRLIAHVREVAGVSTIDAAIQRVPLLLDKNTPLKHWSRTVLFGPDARVPVGGAGPAASSSLVSRVAGNEEGPRAISTRASPGRRRCRRAPLRSPSG